MAHFSKLDNTNIVIEVIVAEQEFINTLPDSSSYVQTSFNTHHNVHYDPITMLPDDGIPLRGNYGRVGATYDFINDVFINPQPYNSWVLNTGSWSWEPPSPPGWPEDRNYPWVWNEDLLQWEEPILDVTNADEWDNQVILDGE